MRYLIILTLLTTSVKAQNIVLSEQSSHYGLGVSVSSDLAHTELLLQVGTDVRINSKAYLSPFSVRGNLTGSIVINPFIYGAYSRNLESNFYHYGVGLNLPFKPFDVNLFVNQHYQPEVSLSIPI